MAQIQSNRNNFLESNTFKKVENQIIARAVSGARRELDLFKFEIAYSQIVSKQEIEEVEEEIVNIREKKWQEALKKANGDEKKALMLV